MTTEDFFFFITENPIPFETYKQLRRDDGIKTQAEINRQYKNNINWKYAVLKKAIQQSHDNAVKLKNIIEKTKKTKKTIKKKQKESKKEQVRLDKWM